MSTVAIVANKRQRPSAGPQRAKAFKSQFPGVVAAITDMAADDGEHLGYNFGKVAADKQVLRLAKQAELAFRKMSSGEREVFTLGEDVDQKRIATKYGALGAAAHKLLNRVFDHGFEND
jgi:hypothetical protein